MMKYSMDTALELDRSDILAHFRSKFVISDPKLIYLDGNSLGRLPLKTREELSSSLQNQWGDRLIRSWNEGWYDLSSNLGSKLAALIGAKAKEVIFCDTTSVNLYKLIYGALKARPGKTSIVSDVHNFPSDLYLLQGIQKSFHNEHKIILSGRPDETEVDYKQLFKDINEDTALVCLSHVSFKSSFLYDMKRVTDHAHKQGALVIWDLSHAVGAVPIDLNECNADMAVGCSYKYLNGGPGAPAFLYVREDLHEQIPSPIWAWFGESNPFDFSLNYRPAKGIRKYMTGTPPVLSLKAIEPALEIVLEAGIEKIRKKSQAQTEFLINILELELTGLGFSLGSSRDPEKRGSHVSIKHPEAYRICKAMMDDTLHETIVIPDFREPDNIRLGITPLYTTFEEIRKAMDLIVKITKNDIYKRYQHERDAVT